MKGFAATPIVFIAVFLITSLLFMHFLDIDKRVAEGVGKESRLVKLQADSIKLQAANGSSIASWALTLAQYSENESVMEGGLKQVFGNSIDVVDGAPGDRKFLVNWQFTWNGTLIEANITSSRQASEAIAYPFYELTDADKSWSYSGAYDDSCQNVENNLNNYLSSSFPAISWNRTYGSCYYVEGYGNLKDLWVISNYITGTLSAKHQHVLGTSRYAGTCPC